MKDLWSGEGKKEPEKAVTGADGLAAVAPGEPTKRDEAPKAAVGTPASPVSKVGQIGRGVRIRGQLRGREDLQIEGGVEGNISLPENHLILERSAEIRANVQARDATIRGRIRGNTDASDKLEISAEARVLGDVKAPRLVIREGAKFRGRIEMDVPLPPGLEPGAGDA